MNPVALVNIIESERRAIRFGSGVLNRVAPLFFRPRLQTVIKMDRIGLGGFRVVIPLTSTGWSQVNDETRQKLFRQSLGVCSNNNLPLIAVNRGLSEDLDLNHKLHTGDYLITTLALLKTELIAERMITRRVVIAGADLPFFQLARLMQERYQIPVTLQSMKPAELEAEASRMLYRDGIPLTIAPFNPQSWAQKDIIIFFHEYYAYWGELYGLGAKVNLCNNSTGHAPLLEEELKNSGINPTLENLAPLLETHILGSEEGVLSEMIECVEDKGKEVFFYFLDKDFVGPYNTLKGLWS